MIKNLCQRLANICCSYQTTTTNFDNVDTFHECDCQLCQHVANFCRYFCNILQFESATFSKLLHSLPTHSTDEGNLRLGRTQISAQQLGRHVATSWTEGRCAPPRPVKRLRAPLGCLSGAFSFTSLALGFIKADFTTKYTFCNICRDLQRTNDSSFDVQTGLLEHGQLK